MQRDFRRLTLTPALFILLTLPVWPMAAMAQSASEPADGSRSEPRLDNSAFANSIAGTYFIKEGTDPTDSTVVSITADGRWLSINSREHLSGFSDQQGTWKKTGPREITATVLNFGFDPSTGEPNAVDKLVWTVTFDSKYLEIKGQFSGEGFAPDQNPLDPTEPPVRTYSQRFHGWRVIAGK